MKLRSSAGSLKHWCSDCFCFASEACPLALHAGCGSNDAIHGLHWIKPASIRSGLSWAMKGLPLLILPLIASLPSALQTPSKSALLSEPGRASLRDPQTATSSDRALLTFTAASVLVEGLPDGLKADLSRDEVSEWTSNFLKNLGIKVLSESDQMDSLHTRALPLARGDEVGVLEAEDRFWSEVYVNINAIKSPGNLTAYSVSIEVKRGAFIHPGFFTKAGVWDRSLLGMFGSSIGAKDKIKGAVTSLMKDLETDLLSARAAKK